MSYYNTDHSPDLTSWTHILMEVIDIGANIAKTQLVVLLHALSAWLSQHTHRTHILSNHK